MMGWSDSAGPMLGSGSPFRGAVWIAVLYLVSSLVPAHRLSAQNGELRSALESRFTAALTAFENKQHETAAREFEWLCAAEPVHARSTAACVMAARAWLLASHPEKTMHILADFFARFPQSSYGTEVYLLIGDAATKLGERRTALRAYISGCNATKDESTRALLLTFADSTIQAGVQWNDLHAALEGATGQIASTILLRWADREASLGRPDAARQAMAHLPRDSAGPEIAKLRELVRYRMGSPTDTLRMFVVLPLAGNAADSAIIRDMHDGIATALRLHIARGGVPIGMQTVALNSEDSLAQVFASMKHLRRVVGIIGGVFSADAAILAKAAGNTGLPCIIPAATAPNLTNYGPNIIQLNTPFALRGSVLADYAKKAFPGARFAVLAPLDGYARALAERFVTAARALGLSVDVVSWYNSGTKDLRTQYKTIAERIARSDSATVLFAPVVSSDDLAAVLAGYKHSGSTGTILGAGDWNHPDILNQHLVPGMRVLFESDFAVNTGFSQYRDFIHAYRGITHRESTRDAIFGYDAARFFLSCISSGSVVREDILARTRSTFLGLRSPIDLREGRINMGLNIMGIEDGKVIRIATVPDQ